jgi:cellulose synthase operon protein YhjQ
MTDRRALPDQTETPDDVATLYSWANLHGAKYRDFSAARAQTREKARLRVQEAIDDEQRRNQEIEVERRRNIEIEAAQRQAQIQRAADAARSAEEAHKTETAAQAAREAEGSRQQAANRAKQLAAERIQQQAAEREARRLVMQATERSAQQAAADRAWQQAPYQQPMQQPMSESEAAYAPPRGAWEEPEQHEASSGPAWLMGDRQEAGSQSGAGPFVAQAPEDTLQGSRERMTARWYALRSLYEPGAVAQEVAPAPVVARMPVVAVFSLAGGVGKTSLVATLGRALAATGERILLVDTASFGLLPFFFGARDQRPGVLRTFSPGGYRPDAPVQLITIDPEGFGADVPEQETLANEIARHAREANRVIIDLATASGATSRRIIRMQPLVLVPVVPDMNSVVSVSSIDAFFQHNTIQLGKPIQPYYILNQFDSTLPLNLDVREVLRAQLGDRLLPFVLRRGPAMSEALAEGMTVMDYAPTSGLADDFNQLAGWVKSQSSPASTTYRGVRWSER